MVEGTLYCRFLLLYPFISLSLSSILDVFFSIPSFLSLCSSSTRLLTVLIHRAWSFFHCSSLDYSHPLPSSLLIPPLSTLLYSLLMILVYFSNFFPFPSAPSPCIFQHSPLLFSLFLSYSLYFSLILSFPHYFSYPIPSGPKASGGEGDKGCGFRGPGETKMETDKRAIREKIVLLTREISLLGMQREQHRKSR